MLRNYSTAYQRAMISHFDPTSSGPNSVKLGLMVVCKTIIRVFDWLQKSFRCHNNDNAGVALLRSLVIEADHFFS